MPRSGELIGTIATRFVAVSRCGLSPRTPRRKPIKSLTIANVRSAGRFPSNLEQCWKIRPQSRYVRERNDANDLFLREPLHIRCLFPAPKGAQAVDDRVVAGSAGRSRYTRWSAALVLALQPERRPNRHYPRFKKCRSVPATIGLRIDVRRSPALGDWASASKPAHPSHFFFAALRAGLRALAAFGGFDVAASFWRRSRAKLFRHGHDLRFALHPYPSAELQSKATSRNSRISFLRAHFREASKADGAGIDVLGVSSFKELLRKTKDLLQFCDRRFVGRISSRRS